MLDLLEHRVGDAALERVAGEEEDGEAIGVRDPGRGHHVQRAGADRGGRDHDLTPARRLREADRGERHPLLVLSAEGEELLPRLVQRVSQAEHVPVAEDREHAGERAAPPRRRAQCAGLREADDRLCRRQPDGLHAATSAMRVTSSQAPDDQERTSASCTST